MGIELEITCDEGNHRIQQGELIICKDCFDEAKKECAELETKVSELEEELREAKNGKNG